MNKITWFFITILAFSSVALAQSTAVEIGDYIGSKGDFQLLADTTQNAIERLLKESADSKLAIIIYPGFRFEGSCIDGAIRPNEITEKFVRRVVGQYKNIDSSRFTFIRGDTSNIAMARFWLVPSGKASPEPHQVDFHPPCCCSSIIVVGIKNADPKASQLEFFADLSEHKSTDQLTFTWTTSPGKISSGQGTSEITVDIQGVEAENVKVTAAIKVNPACGCPNNASFTTKLSPK